MNNEQFWRAVLGNLELSLSKPNFTTWFKNTFVVNSTPGGVTIGVPNTFTKEWLQKKYHQNILQAVRSIDPEIREIRYEIGSFAKPPAISPQLDQKTELVTRKDTKIEEAPQKPRTLAGILNPKFSFGNFIVGKTNELAHAAALAITEKPGTAYNPLFIYGGVGLGKTHLMQAVGRKIIENTPQSRVLYVSAERFINEFIMAVKDGRAHDFKNRYRKLDVLLIDDIQSLAGKEQTQEEFFHTFNALHNHNKQIIITSDRLPKEIPSIEERLVSRFEGGMVADIQAPDLETRTAILKSKVKEKNYEISSEVINFIATNIESNIRELEGALNRVIVYCQINTTKPSLDKVKEILSSLIAQPKKRGLTPRKIMEAAANFYNVTIEDLVKQSRKKEFVKPRQISMYLIRKELETSLPSIGEFFGGRDHTTVIHAINKINRIKKEDDNLKQELLLIVDKACL
ncbi:MAG: chromosomal replication initiator protein DnaA [Candidatus Doudnabacteria bacterium CG10_big_fil_rev_8_21_14_0_10_41_10]|uniref:Chromosomal replication initiator protein DnaA n=1 Tax=Candidatus Doudnabacteria bacterium CG10_big_fil_rev_8_21_14_0_10_41_10 TaxID=1974551 RepID=A0A2H0VC66_9BACT|nr:MAG: chromosomal replication initiator protein DnaA [Candidatus Doudnabacteria bacterium CG10_big_fil_rev_8_21_14_0_10_41_10]